MDFSETNLKLRRLMKMKDYEVAHGVADEILQEIALDTELTTAQRRILVELYQQVGKWYA